MELASHKLFVVGPDELLPVWGRMNSTLGGYNYTSLKMRNMDTESRVRIRPAESKDRDFIISLAPRMAEFGPPHWRDPAQMASADQRVLDNVLSTRPPKTAIFIAEDSETGTALGFIHLNTNSDYYTLEEHGHISDIVVAATEERRGVGHALMEAGEEWARRQGYRLLTLNVFVENRTARRLYEKLGYGEETIKYVKEMR
jgi:GNAT superfamily N-acetyltransferase